MAYLFRRPASGFVRPAINTSNDIDKICQWINFADKLGKGGN